MRKGRTDWDVAVIGAGPVGAVTALAHARRGARVLMLEANPSAANRFAGEWLHPPAREALDDLGVTLPACVDTYDTGRGFVTFPDDGTDPMVLPYADDSLGFAVEHSDLVESIRGTAADHDLIDYVPYARVGEIRGQRLSWTLKRGRGPTTASAGRIVGADGRSSIARKILDLPVDDRVTCSRMAGVILRGVELPNEGYGHVFLGGPGPILAYRIGTDAVRLCLDVPLADHRGRTDRPAWLWDAFSPVLPRNLLPAFREELAAGRVQWAVNQVRPRTAYGRRGLALVGDAAGHYHPLTAAGMTLGFADGVALAGSRTFQGYRLSRLRDTRVPEMLAVALYEVFADELDEALLIRQAVYDMWRSSETERRRTMRFLACQDTSLAAFSSSFVTAVKLAVSGLASKTVATGQWRHGGRITRDLGKRLRWLGAGLAHVGSTTATPGVHGGGPRTAWDGWLHASRPETGIVELRPRSGSHDDAPSPVDALQRGVEALQAAQRPDGDWEGEVVWCALLPAQYVLACHVMGEPVHPARRKRLIQQLRVTQLESGLWGLHRHSKPYLFVTTLAYVAGRLLGLPANDPLLAPAQAFIAREDGVVGIPSWGKLWLAMLNLYDWDGVNPVLPEAWRLPESVPAHPSNFYCHTRLIYLAMSVISARRYRAPLTPLLTELRGELFPASGFHGVDWTRARSTLCEGDTLVEPSPLLRVGYAAARVVERHVDPQSRATLLAELRERIRWELRSSDHTSISPVSGMLNMIALWLHDPDDADLARAREQFEGWIWEDDEDGTRVAGARSASWDTAFALQALQAAADGGAHVDEGSVASGEAFLRSQQIRESFPGYAEQYRIDPDGGWCFAGVWHGWPVSDCTAEALSALLGSDAAELDEAAAHSAARFILRAQNVDGGFGSYERRKGRIDLELLNPAEMFADSMTDRSWIECTASCIAALAAFARRHPELRRREIQRAIAHGATFLRNTQRPDGAWSGAWGVHFTYGTMFGVRGLREAGVPSTDPAIRRAADWVRAHQRADGGWAEGPGAGIADRYESGEGSHAVQTAWALTALIEARDADWSAIDRGAEMLARLQREDGTWPRQQMAGVFFRTALLEYALYRQTFPVWALGLVEQARSRRLRGDGWELGGANVRSLHATGRAG